MQDKELTLRELILYMRDMQKKTKGAESKNYMHVAEYLNEVFILKQRSEIPEHLM